MNAKAENLDLRTKMKLAGTSMLQAKQVVAYDTIVRNGGTASRKLILEECERRLVEPLDGYLYNRSTANNGPELSTRMSSYHNWVTCRNAIWEFNDGAIEDLKEYFNYARNYDFGSVDEFLEVLNRFTEPLNAEPKEEPKPKVDLHKVVDSIKDSMKNTEHEIVDILRNQIQNAEAHVQKLKKIFEDHYPDHTL